MTFREVVEKRRSIRSYLPTPVPEDMMMQLLKWGHMAPTGGNLFPWEFILVRDEKVRRAMVDSTFCGNQQDDPKHQEWMMSAPVILAVCAVEERVKARYGNTDMWRNLLQLDCSACVENILLGVVDLGLSSCYISGFHEEPLRKALQLPDGVTPIAMLPIGFSDQVGVARPKPDVATLVHYDTFGNQG